MDTKPLEHEALDQVKTLLARYDFKFAEMNFDENGADIFIIKPTENESFWKCLKGQSKGRNVSKTSSEVVIPCSYVTDNFLVFVYVKNESEDDVKTYLFTAEDVRNNWKLKSNTYQLSIPKDFNKGDGNKKYLFNKSRSVIIDKIMKEVGEVRKDSDVQNLSEADFYFKMWKKIGGLPPYEYIRDIFEEGNVIELINTDKFVFLLCASIIVNEEFADISLSIDWAFYYLKYSENKKNIPNGNNLGNTFFANVAITYHNTWVKEVLSNEGRLIGYHLHVGDKEESVDAFVMKNGEFGVVYNGNTSSHNQ